MLPAVYRLWARVRLAHLQPWISLWASAHTFAGVEGKGAADAAYDAAIRMEYYKLKEIPLIGGSANIYKCFDQLQRGLIEKI